MATPAALKPLATLYHTNKNGHVQNRDEIYTWEDRRLLSRKDDGVYTIAIDCICREPTKRADLTKSPLSETIFMDNNGFLASYREFEAVWHNKSGSTNHEFIQYSDIVRQKLHLQTPNDGGTFFSFYMEQDQDPSVFHCIFMSCDEEIQCDEIFDAWEESRHRHELKPALGSWGGKALPIPMVLGEYLVEDTNLGISSLAQLLEDIETEVATGDDLQFRDLVRSLHECNLKLIKLRCRRKFEKGFLECISSFIFNNLLLNETEHGNSQAKKGLDEATIRGHFKDFWAIKDEPYYDLDELTTRITNSFTAVYNLVAQRDMKASAELAATSQQIAKDALRDSTAMKTIAIMTLIFLPATFLCSFFSMTMFDWSPSKGEPITNYLWVYFACLVPLTIVVVVAWVLFTRTTREKLQRWLLKKGWRKEPAKEKV